MKTYNTLPAYCFKYDVAVHLTLFIKGKVLMLNTQGYVLKVLGAKNNHVYMSETIISN